MAELPRTTGRENLYRADGSRRPDAEVLAESGNIGLRLALLDDAMHRRAVSADLGSQYPPRLFLSYKWGSETENAWVAQLAQRLTKHGWGVVFDQLRDETADRSVEEFVSRLVSCRVFVAVLSPAFITSAIVAKHASWAFDEMQCALMARSRMRLVGIVPPPGLAGGAVEPTPAPIRLPPRPDELAIVVEGMRTPEFDEVHEVCDTDGLERFLDQSLTYNGPGLDNEPWAARSHLLLACRGTDSGAAPHDTLAVVYMHLGLLARAAAELERALGIDAALATARRNLEKVRAARAASNEGDATEIKGPLPGCSDCEAIFMPRHGRPFTCAACGASRPARVVPCDVCGAEGYSPIAGFAGRSGAVHCPICRTGIITSKDHASL